MARYRRMRLDDEHLNHEAWAIPYADLLTLLLAFFVVMYALSSINEGKYRILASSLSSAFGGPPRSITPIQLGEAQVRGSDFDMPVQVSSGTPASPSMAAKVVRALDKPSFDVLTDMPVINQNNNGPARTSGEQGGVDARSRAQLQRISSRIQAALRDLVAENLVRVRYNSAFIEVEIQSDILFASGVAAPSPVAVATVARIGEVLAPEPNPIRVEGYTDNVPIATARFPSNWELSAARASSVVHELVRNGVDAPRLAVAGFGEHQPIDDNTTAGGRNRNRRVTLVILADRHDRGEGASRPSPSARPVHYADRPKREIDAFASHPDAAELAVDSAEAGPEA